MAKQKYSVQTVGRYKIAKLFYSDEAREYLRKLSSSSSLDA
jgi:hypothetical protein